jgi:hypothetical protein
MEIGFNEKEAKVLAELAETKGVSQEQFIRQGLALLQAIQLGIYKIEEDPNHPVNQLRMQKAPQVGIPDKPVKFVFEGLLTCGHPEDGGKALVGEMEGVDGFANPELFVRIQSWDEAKDHADMQKINNKQIRVTVETV